MRWSCVTGMAWVGLVRAVGSGCGAGLFTFSS